MRAEESNTRGGPREERAVKTDVKKTNHWTGVKENDRKTRKLKNNRNFNEKKKLETEKSTTRRDPRVDSSERKTIENKSLTRMDRKQKKTIEKKSKSKKEKKNLSTEKSRQQ